MKRFTRVLALVLSCCMCVSMLACGSEGGSSNGSGKSGSGDREEIKVAYWLSGLGEQWLSDLAAAFEEKQDKYTINYITSPTSTALTSAFGMEDMDETDLYFSLNIGFREYMEPLDSLLESTADGDTKPLKEKFNAKYLEFEKADDGHYYTLTYGGGMINLYYNKDLMEQAGITQLPRTSDELTVLCDNLSSQGIVPICHFKGGGYYEFLMRLYMAQYDGLDYYLNNWITCTDEAGNSPSKDVLTKKDGRYYALKAMEKFLTPDYTLPGSTTQTHTEIQTMFLNKSAAMMINGSWIENEMKASKGQYNIATMKLPVISAIVNTLDTVKSDALLRSVVTAVDQVSDGEKTAADFASGDGYMIDGTLISASDWTRIYEARNMIQGNYAKESAFVPKYSAQKEGALEFLKFMYSDAGYQIYAKATKCPLPMNLSGGSIDMSEMSDTQISQFELINKDISFVDLTSARESLIYLIGGASLMASINYVDKFCAANADDRMSADDVWALMVKTVEENYENNWLLNIEVKKEK